MFENDYRHFLELGQDHNQAIKQEEKDPKLYLQLLLLPRKISLYFISEHVAP